MRGFNVTLKSITTVESGQMYILETGAISSRDYPKSYPNNYERECSTSLLPGNMIDLQFIERFSLERSNNCTHDHVRVINKLGKYVF